MKNWLPLAMLAAESQTVIALRMMKLAAGGAAAQQEMQRMVTEKMDAAVQASTMLMLGRGSKPVVKHYRSRVRRNARRLTRKRR